MKICVVSGSYPRRANEREAAEIVSYEIISNLLELGHDVSFLCVNTNVPKKDGQDSENKANLRKKGLTCLGFRKVEKAISKSGKSFIWLFINLIFERKKKNSIEQEVDSSNYDCVLIIWSEVANEALENLNTKKLTYTGNPDGKVIKAHLKLLKYNNYNFIYKLLKKFSLITKAYIVNKINIRTLKKYQYIFNVACNDSKFYSSSGIKNSIYMPNIWKINYKQFKLHESYSSKKNNKINVCASIGNIQATGNMLGLDFLNSELYSQLNYEFKDQIILNIYGGGVKNILHQELDKHSNIIFHGFVDDLNQEIMKSDIFLIMNNCYEDFVVCHTRYLHSWSLGCPVVGMTLSQAAMPELVNEKNCLLARNPIEIVSCIKQIRDNQALKKQLIEGGYNSLINDFNPSLVTKRIIDYAMR